jgi:hypothetical protein
MGEYLIKYLLKNTKIDLSNDITREVIENFIFYAIENFNNYENQLAYYLSDMIPEISFKDFQYIINNYGESE